MIGRSGCRPLAPLASDTSYNSKASKAQKKKKQNPPPGLQMALSLLLSSQCHCHDIVNVNDICQCYCWRYCQCCTLTMTLLNFIFLIMIKKRFHTGKSPVGPHHYPLCLSTPTPIPSLRLTYPDRWAWLWAWQKAWWPSSLLAFSTSGQWHILRLKGKYKPNYYKATSSLLQGDWKINKELASFQMG